MLPTGLRLAIALLVFSAAACGGSSAQIDGPPTKTDGNVTDAPPPPPLDAAMTCGDGQHNGDETDLDCGGSCVPAFLCGVDQHCLIDADCVSHQCTGAGRCADLSCGNGMLDPTELCDDGNLQNGDGCEGTCRPTGCGDGTLTGGEACDDGNATSGDGCDANCQPSGCGNGAWSAFEQCDDGNLVSGDGCSASCTIECGVGEVPAVASVAPQLPIEIGGVTTTTVELFELGTITRLEVNLGYLAHPRATDLHIELIGPTGTARDLVPAGVTNSFGFQTTTFADGAGQDLSSGTPPYAGRFRPAQSLSVNNDFYATTAPGLWTLRLTDASTGIGGTLQDWSLAACIAPNASMRAAPATNPHPVRPRLR